MKIDFARLLEHEAEDALEVVGSVAADDNAWDTLEVASDHAGESRSVPQEVDREGSALGADVGDVDEGVLAGPSEEGVLRDWDTRSKSAHCSSETDGGANLIDVEAGKALRGEAWSLTTLSAVLLLEDGEWVVHDGNNSCAEHAALNVDWDLAGLWVLEGALEGGALLLEDVAGDWVGNESGASHHA